MKTSPTQRTLVFLRASGHVVAVVERWNPHAKVRQDLFGFLDLVAMHEGVNGVLGVQATTGSNHSKRIAKLIALDVVRLWLACGNRLWVMSWAKRGARGKPKRWEPRIEEVTIGMFSGWQEK